MYNDYYLQSIDNKMATIITNTNTIINEQQNIKQEIKTTNDTITIIVLLLATFIIYKFIERCFR